jgi:hypothetical protein
MDLPMVTLVINPIPVGEFGGSNLEIGLEGKLGENEDP